MKPHPFLLVFLFLLLLQKGNLDGPDKLQLQQEGTRGQNRPCAPAFPGWGLSSAAPQLGARSPGPPLIPPPVRRSPDGPSPPHRSLPCHSPETLRPTSRAGVPGLPVRDTHLGARSWSRGLPGSSQLGRPPSSAAPGVPGRQYPEEKGLTWKKRLGRPSEGLPCRESLKLLSS